jgi:hypothetical protein
MAISRTLRRLLRIRELEEEQSRLVLESALGELNCLKQALVASAERNRRGRILVADSLRTGQLPDRIAGLEEMRAAGRLDGFLKPRIEDKEEDVMDLRQDYLLKRVEQRQAETLLQEGEAREAAEADRRGQQALDGWYGSRLYRAELQKKTEAASENEMRAEF